MIAPSPNQTWFGHNGPVDTVLLYMYKTWYCLHQCILTADTKTFILKKIVIDENILQSQILILTTIITWYYEWHNHH